MNKPYTCHLCGTVFDVWPTELDDCAGNSLTSVPSKKVKVKCPGCYDAGFTSAEVNVYTVDTTTDPPTLVQG
jgi:hypothetical protein